MNVACRPPSFGIVVCLIALMGASWPSEGLAQALDKANALVGGWTLNKEQSVQPENEAPPADRGRSAAGRPGRGGGGSGRGRGGFGGGGGGRNGGFGGGTTTPENTDASARLRDAMRAITNPPDHLVIVATETMIVLTGPDGRTTRLSPDGKKVKDENTNIERKTKWDGARLVSEISGLGSGKTTETYSVDVEHHQLHLVAETEGGPGGVRTFSHVYDLDAR